MKTVRLLYNRVAEIIPEKAKPVSKWYNEAFASQCVDAPDNVSFRWIYDPNTKTFSPPKEENDEEEVSVDGSAVS